MSKNKEDNSGLDAVLNYLVAQNRPYSCNDIVANLHNDYSKTVVQKSLDKLVETSRIREKAYGKQKVYLIDQSNFATATQDEIKKMEVDIEAKEVGLKEMQSKNKEYRNYMKELDSSLTTKDARSQVQNLENELGPLRAKLNGFKSTTVVLDVTERNKIREQREFVMKNWRSRRRIANDIINTILESYPKSKKELLEDIGVEIDEKAEKLFKTL